MRMQRTLGVLLATFCWLSLGPGWVSSLRADEPLLTLTEIDAPTYPTLRLTIECQHWPAGAPDIGFALRENDSPTEPPQVLQQLIKTQPVQLFFLLDLPVIAATRYNVEYTQTVLQRISTFLRSFNDACRWSDQEHLYIFAPDEQGQMVQLSVESNSDLGTVANAIQNLTVQASKATQLHTLIQQILTGGLPENSKEQLYVVIVSDGTFAASDQSNYQQVRAAARVKAQLFGIFLEDAPVTDEDNLEKIVGKANLCASTDELCLRTFWQRWTRPNHYQLTYISSNRPPFEIAVQPVISGTVYPVAATKTFWSVIPPVQVEILYPASGAVIAVSTTITSSQWLTAQVRLTAPSAGRAYQVSGLTYRLDDGAAQALTAGRPFTLTGEPLILPIPLETIFTQPGGIRAHRLQVQVQAATAALNAQAETFFWLSDQAAAITQNAAELATTRQKTTGLEAYVEWLRVWWPWILLAALLLMALLAFTPWLALWPTQRREQEKLQKLQHQVNALTTGLRMPVGALTELEKVRAGLFLVQGVGLLSFIPIKEGETVSLGSNYYLQPN